MDAGAEGCCGLASCFSGEGRLGLWPSWWSGLSPCWSCFCVFASGDGEGTPWPAGCDASTTGAGVGVAGVVVGGVGAVVVGAGGVGAVVVGAGGVGATEEVDAVATFGWPTWRGAVVR